MAHNNTVLAQVLKLVPRHEFESLARKHKSGRMSRNMTRWSQFVAMGMAQLTETCVMTRPEESDMSLITPHGDWKHSRRACRWRT